MQAHEGMETRLCAELSDTHEPVGMAWLDLQTPLISSGWGGGVDASLHKLPEAMTLCTTHWVRTQYLSASANQIRHMRT